MFYLLDVGQSFDPTEKYYFYGQAVYFRKLHKLLLMKHHSEPEQTMRGTATFLSQIYELTDTED